MLDVLNNNTMMHLLTLVNPVVLIVTNVSDLTKINVLAVLLDYSYMINLGALPVVLLQLLLLLLQEPLKNSAKTVKPLVHYANP